MMQNIQKLTYRRRRMLLGVTFGYGFSLIAFFFYQMTSNREQFHYPGIAALLLGLAGWGVWSFYLIKILRMQQQLKEDPIMDAALNDEYIQHLRLKAFYIAFWVVLIIQGVLYAVNIIIPLSVQMVILTTISTAVMAGLISFIILDRE